MINKVCNRIEVCFSPALFDHFLDRDAIVVVVDVLRATSAICTALMNGSIGIIPVGDLEEARRYKQNGYLVAAERDGIQLDFADFGNSPYNFTAERVGGKQIVYSTTNGTSAIHLAASCHKVVIGSFLNVSAVCNWLFHRDRNVVVLCAGWKNRFSLEDALLAGSITEKLLAYTNFETTCDSSIAAMDLYSIAKVDINGYMEKSAQQTRLRKSGLDEVIPYCLTSDISTIIPVYHDGLITGEKEY